MPYLVHEANPGLLHSLTALGVGHEGQQMLLEDVLALPVKAAIVLAGLLEIVLLLNPLLHAGTRGIWRCPGSAVRLAGSIVINVVLLGGMVVHLRKVNSVSDVIDRVYQMSLTHHVHSCCEVANGIRCTVSSCRLCVAHKTNHDCFSV